MIVGAYKDQIQDDSYTRPSDASIKTGAQAISVLKCQLAVLSHYSKFLGTVAVLAWLFAS